MEFLSLCKANRRRDFTIRETASEVINLSDVGGDVTMYRGEGTSHRGDVILNREFRLNFEAFRGWHLVCIQIIPLPSFKRG